MLYIILYFGFVLAGVGIGIYIGTILNCNPETTMNKIHWIVRIITGIGVLMSVCAGRALGL